MSIEYGKIKKVNVVLEEHLKMLQLEVVMSIDHSKYVSVNSKRYANEFTTEFDDIEFPKPFVKDVNVKDVNVTLSFLQHMLTISKKKNIDELAGLPVIATMDNTTLVDWRILHEAI